MMPTTIAPAEDIDAACHKVVKGSRRTTPLRVGVRLAFVSGQGHVYDLQNVYRT